MFYLGTISVRKEKQQYKSEYFRLRQDLMERYFLLCTIFAAVPLVVWPSQTVLNCLSDFPPSSLQYLLIRDKLQFFDWTCISILFPVNVPLMQNNNELGIQPDRISRSFCKWKCNILTKIYADIDIHCTFNSHWCRPLAGRGGGTGPRLAAALSGSWRRCRGPGTSSGARSRCI